MAQAMTASAPDVARRSITLVPLGGLGEIGRNMLALECGEDIVVIDAGLMFPEQEMLGIDLVIPDISWLLERGSRVRGILLTHGHEDHIGGLPYILPRLAVPVFGTAITLGFLRNKLREHRLLDAVELRTVHAGDTVELGALSCEFVHITHSIPDACALAIRTPLGIIVHTGDFKIDHTPVIGEGFDIPTFARYGNEGVLALFSDSTNVERPGYTPSERAVVPRIAQRRRVVRRAAGADARTGRGSRRVTSASILTQLSGRAARRYGSRSRGRSRSTRR